MFGRESLEVILRGQFSTGDYGASSSSPEVPTGPWSVTPAPFVPPLPAVPPVAVVPERVGLVPL